MGVVLPVCSSPLSSTFAAALPVYCEFGLCVDFPGTSFSTTSGNPNIDVAEEAALSEERCGGAIRHARALDQDSGVCKTRYGVNSTHHVPYSGRLFQHPDRSGDLPDSFPCQHSAGINPHTGGLTHHSRLVTAVAASKVGTWPLHTRWCL